MADLKAERHPVELTTLGLGSCVGIALFDPVNRVVGMAHCMLPDSQQIRDNANEAKFVDTAVVRLILEMAKLGARKDMIKAKLAGGAQMFPTAPNSDFMRIGDRNVEAALRILSYYGIPVIAQETGETYGRTITLDSEGYGLSIKTIGHGVKVI